MKIPTSELKNKKIFVGTPMYGGMCHGTYTKACLSLANIGAQYDLDIIFFYVLNESLITRARNYIVDEFLRSDCTHLMFIDSDIDFNAVDVLILASLCNDNRPIIGGPCPKKCIAWEKVHKAVCMGIGNENPEELGKYTGRFTINTTEKTTEVRINEPVEMLEIGTGFMIIQRNTFEKIRDAYPQFSYKADHSQHFNGERYIHAFFDTVIDNEAYAGKGAGGSDRYLSEDYMFCQWARKIGLTTWLCPWMEISHSGTYLFNGSLRVLANLP